ncbi:MAG: hypothetical protein AVDCRST_MAG08-326, partial [uncultured Acetobacteraceae bacterium]
CASDPVSTGARADGSSSACWPRRLAGAPTPPSAGGPRNRHLPPSRQLRPPTRWRPSRPRPRPGPKPWPCCRKRAAAPACAFCAPTAPPAAGSAARCWWARASTNGAGWCAGTTATAGSRPARCCAAGAGGR